MLLQKCLNIFTSAVNLQVYIFYVIDVTNHNILQLGTCIFPAFSLTLVGKGLFKRATMMSVLCECLVIKTEDDTETGLLPGSNGKILFALVICSVNSSNAISVLPQSKYVIQSLMMLI